MKAGDLIRWLKIVDSGTGCLRLMAKLIHRRKWPMRQAPHLSDQSVRETTLTSITNTKSTSALKARTGTFPCVSVYVEPIQPGLAGSGEVYAS